jgi:hypothetical protein
VAKKSKFETVWTDIMSRRVEGLFDQGGAIIEVSRLMGINRSTFARWAKPCICPSEAMRCTCGDNHAIGRILTKKPITAQDDEIKQNPRSRSAKMRIFEMDIADE